MYSSILVPVDLSVEANTDALLGKAKTLAAAWGSEVHVASVIPEMGMAIVGSHFGANHEAEARAAVTQQLSARLEAVGLNAQTHVMTGTIYDKVIALAAQLKVDLIVIGAHRPELKDYLLGSNAARVVRHSSASVLVVRD